LHRSDDIVAGCAQITAGKVTRYDPVDASITCEVMIPHGVTTPTCVALGGKDMRTLFITSLDG